MKPELLSPAGSYDAAVAAFQYGADAVYLGLPDFSARAEAQNLTLDELALLRAYAATFSPPKKIYVTLNTLLNDREIAAACHMLTLIDELRPDGIIVQDLGLARLIRRHFPALELHASTQMAAHNPEAVHELRDLGFKRVVLARELSLHEIGAIVAGSEIEIEIFIHGALCYGYSGLCLFSSLTQGRSGNRGRCAYCCRHSFACDSGAGHPFSMKDLALLPILDRVVSTGVHSLKIEGRMKSPLYVACVTSAYRRKLDGHLGPEEERQAVEEIKTIFSRPWTELYARASAPDVADIIDAETVGHRGALIGRAVAVVREGGQSRWLRVTTTRELQKFDGIQVDIPGNSRPFGFSVRNMRRHGETRTIMQAPPGTEVEIEIAGAEPPRIAPGAPIYCASSQQVQQRYRVVKPRPADLKTGIPLNMSAALQPDGVRIEAFSPVTGDAAALFLAGALEAAHNPERTESAVRRACGRLGGSRWTPAALTVHDRNALYAPPELLNRARRELVAQLDSNREQRLASRWRSLESLLQRPDGGGDRAQPTAPAEFTLKIPLAAPLPLPQCIIGCRRLVVELDHRGSTETLEMLDAVKCALADGIELMLALPLISCGGDTAALKSCVAPLIDAGHTLWESPGLAGLRILKACGVTPVSADWPLYAVNREACRQLRELGFASHVTAPDLTLESALESLVASADGYCEPEMLIFQHTPLFIAATPPHIQGALREAGTALRDERGAEFTLWKKGHEWVTVAAAPLDRRHLVGAALKQGIRRFRIDYAWTPPAAFC